MSSQRPQTNQGLVGAFQHVTDGLLTLFRQHLQLFGIEARHDAAVVGRYASAMAFFVAISLLGYALLNLSAILFAGWAAGMAGMAVTSLLLACINLGFSFRAMLITARRAQGSGLGPQISGGEWDRSRTWAKAIQNNSDLSE